MNDKYSKLIYGLFLVLCAFPFISSPVALLAGVTLSLTIGNPFLAKTQKATHLLLQASVIGLGFGMNAVAALKAGSEGFLYTVSGIAITLFLGYILSTFFKIEKKTAFLISVGTAICGGSAIAAVAPVIDAKDNDTSVALGVVFILNSIALILFPFIGHLLNLTQLQFGIWSAIAIHDTSSVVGAASHYGPVALATATTIKLTRALWIIPVTLISGMMFKSEKKKVKIPWFIIVFFLAMMLNTYLPSMNTLFSGIYQVSKQGLVITLFMIGSNLSRQTLKNVGMKPLALGVGLWFIISVLALLSV